MMHSKLFKKEILEIFNECQTNRISHPRLSKTLMKTYKKMGTQAFWPPFQMVLRMACQDFNRSQSRERFFDFIVKFVLDVNAHHVKTSEAGEQDKNGDGFCELLSWLMQFCLYWHTAIGHGVRFRCVHLISLLLQGLGNEAQISESTYISIQEVLLKRIWDVKAVIRAEAARALTRLQDPFDRDCPVVTAFLYLLRHDSNHEVRRAALKSLAVTTRTLPEVLARTRDISDHVRCTAIEVIVDKVSFRYLTIAKRIKILKEGIRDRSPTVRNLIAQRLLPAWLKACDMSPVRLLKALDVEGFSEACEDAFRLLLQGLTPSELEEMIDNFAKEHLESERRIPIREHLCSESAFFWRLLVDHLRNKVEPEKGDSLLERCLPLGSALSDVLRSLLEDFKAVPLGDMEQRVENEFVVVQLFRLASHLDPAEEFGRQAMRALVRDCLTAPSNFAGPGLVSILLDLLIGLESDTSEVALSEKVVEMISELRSPLSAEVEQMMQTTCVAPSAPASQDDPGVDKPSKIDRKFELKLAALKVAINEAKEELDECVTRMDFEAAGPLRDRLKTLEEEKNSLMLQLRATEEPQQAEAEGEEGAENDDSKKAEEPEEEKELLDDVDTLIKANTMAVELLKRMRKSPSLTPSLRSLVPSLILTSIQNPEPAVRTLAVLGLGLTCVLDRGLARKYLPLFVQISQVDHVEIRVTALKCVFDCYLVFGLETFLDCVDGSNESNENKLEADTTLGQLFKEDDEPEKEITTRKSTLVDGVLNVAASIASVDTRNSSQISSMLSFIVDFLDSDASELRTVCVEGLARLLFLGHVISSKLLSRLLLLWFNPLTEDDVTLRHCLASFLPAYCFAKADYQASMTEAVMPTLRTLFKAPVTSPLSKVDVWNVASLMLRLTEAASLLSNRTTQGMSPAALDAVDQENNRAEEEADNEEKENEPTLPSTDKSKASSVVTKTPTSVLTKLENPCHDDLALSLANALLNEADPNEIRLYIRMMSNLRLSSSNLPLRKELYVLLDKVDQDPLDRTAQRMLKRFQGLLAVALTSAGVDPKALLREEPREVGADAEMRSDQKRLANLVALEKRKRNRRSSFTRELMGSDDEPTLLDPNLLKDDNPDESQAGEGASRVRPASANSQAEAKTTAFLGTKFGSNVLNATKTVDATMRDLTMLGIDEDLNQSSTIKPENGSDDSENEKETAESSTLTPSQTSHAQSTMSSTMTMKSEEVKVAVEMHEEPEEKVDEPPTRRRSSKGGKASKRDARVVSRLSEDDVITARRRSLRNSKSPQVTPRSRQAADSSDSSFVSQGRSSDAAKTSAKRGTRVSQMKKVVNESLESVEESESEASSTDAENEPWSKRRSARITTKASAPKTATRGRGAKGRARNRAPLDTSDIQQEAEPAPRRRTRTRTSAEPEIEASGMRTRRSLQDGKTSTSAKKGR